MTNATKNSKVHIEFGGRFAGATYCGRAGDSERIIEDDINEETWSKVKDRICYYCYRKAS